MINYNPVARILPENSNPQLQEFVGEATETSLSFVSKLFKAVAAHLCMIIEAFKVKQYLTILM
jgi:hypothetical protein